MQTTLQVTILWDIIDLGEIDIITILGQGDSIAIGGNNTNPGPNRPWVCLPVSSSSLTTVKMRKCGSTGPASKLKR